MADSVQIQCISKSDRQNPHERIEGVGGVHLDKRWYLPLDQAIAGIKDGNWPFWTAGGGTSVWVEIAHHNGNPYLKTKNDGVQPDNLLALPQCPLSSRRAI